MLGLNYFLEGEKSIMKQRQSILFLGDTVCKTFDPLLFKLDASIFDNTVNVANNEGVVLKDSELRRLSDHKGIYSTPDIIKLYHSFNVSLVNLATNHMQDFGDKYGVNMLEFLQANQINSVGFDTDINKAQQPFVDQKNNIVFYSFGASLTGLRYAKKNKPGVNPLEIEDLEAALKECERYPANMTIIFMFNWNYDMEDYPQPAIRQLAHYLIDHGVDAVIGFHPHVFQGMEIYKNKPIVYSLGNFYFPQETYLNFSLRYPSKVNSQALVVLEFEEKVFIKSTIHFTKFDPFSNILTLENSVSIDSDKKCQRLFPMYHLTDNEYSQFFIQNRYIHYLYPIFYKFCGIGYHINKIRVRILMWLVTLAVKLKLKKGYRNSMKDDE